MIINYADIFRDYEIPSRRHFLFSFFLPYNEIANREDRFPNNIE
jgi:hypothetical protein